MTAYTLQRVQELALGESMTAYVGNFEYDIARCNSLSPADKGAPKYKVRLTELADELRHLSYLGKISVDKQERACQRTNNRGKIQDWREFAYVVKRIK